MLPADKVLVSAYRWNCQNILFNSCGNYEIRLVGRRAGGRAGGRLRTVADLNAIIRQISMGLSVHVCRALCDKPCKSNNLPGYIQRKHDSQCHNPIELNNQTIFLTDSF